MIRRRNEWFPSGRRIGRGGIFLQITQPGDDGRFEVLFFCDEGPADAVVFDVSRARDQLTMISTILEATRLEVEKVSVEIAEVKLEAFLEDLRSSYDFPLDKTITLEWEYPSDLPVVKTDPDKLKHVLQNLINNAIKFTEKGSVSVSAWYYPLARSVEFKVADTGIGIPKESQAFVFEMFRQVDSSETRAHGGVGLGLYIVKKFTELLGGKVRVESNPGTGSVFYVKLPVEICPSDRKSVAA